jgi:glycosyltransferase involved in cell wall biosynthesis
VVGAFRGLSDALSRAVFHVGQITVLAVEHGLIRRGRPGLGDVLRAYGKLHSRRARAARWELSRLHSIVVPCYNHAEFLPEAVESIARQDFRPLEIIFIDDASRDGTPEVLQRIVKHLPDGVSALHIRRPRNHGQSSAINLGVLHATGSVITVVNDDDYLFDDAIRLARELIERYQAYLFGGGCEIAEGELPGPRSVSLPAADIPSVRWTPDDIFANPTAFNITHTGSTFMRSAWRAVHGYRPIKRSRIFPAGDREFQLRVASLFPVASASETPFAFWRWGSSWDSGVFS